MPECHKCPNRKRPSPACITCSGPSDGPNNHGKTHVSVDEVAGFVPAPVQTESPSDYDGVLHFIRALCGMGLINREILFSRIMDLQYPEITDHLNCVLTKRLTIQAVHARAKKSLSDPAFRELFRKMVARQHRRTGHSGTKRKTLSSDTRINLVKLIDLLSSKAEAEARIQTLRESKNPTNSQPNSVKNAPLIKIERRRIAVLEAAIVECWKFPFKVNQDI